MSRSEYPILVRNVSKRFGEIVALENVCLYLKRGEIVGLLGPNGSGKTTLLKIIMGLMSPSRGEVKVLGKDPMLNPQIRYKMGYVPEEIVLYDSLTVREFLYFIARMKKMDPKKYIEKIKILITLFEIESKMDELLGSLSKGDRQKIAIISALMHSPPILILDEPSAGLDPIATIILKRILLEMKLRGRVILISTHILELVESLCDRVYLLHKGRVVFEGKISDNRTASKQPSLEDIFLKITRVKDKVTRIEKIIEEVIR